MGRKKRPEPPRVDTSGDTAFRAEERYWKNRRDARDWSRALSTASIVWETEAELQGKVKGVWKHGGKQVECWKIPLDDLQGSGMGQSAWKGKQKMTDDASNYAIVVPQIPGRLR